MGKNQDPGSGINIPDPQHCICRVQSCVWRLPKYWPPPPSPPRQVCPPPAPKAYTLAGQWGGWRVNILEDARYRIGLLQYNLSTLDTIAGSSCQLCAPGYYSDREDAYGPICIKCNCHGHADTCHPRTGACRNYVPLQPPPVSAAIHVLDTFCHFYPEKCIEDTSAPHCRNKSQQNVFLAYYDCYFFGKNFFITRIEDTSRFF